MVLNILILGMEPKNQVIWTTRCKFIAKYISMYCDIFQQKMDDIKIQQKQKLLHEGFALDWTTSGLFSFRKYDFSGI